MITLDKKAQSAMEFLIIFGFGLLIISVLWFASNQNVSGAQTDIQIAQAKNALNRIAQAADIVYVQGSPAELPVYPTFPSSIKDFIIRNNTMEMVIRQGGSDYSIYEDTLSNLTGSIRALAGNRRISVRARDGMVELNG